MEINCPPSFAGAVRRVQADQASHAAEPECIGIVAALKKLSQSACNPSATRVVSKSNNICNHNSVT